MNCKELVSLLGDYFDGSMEERLRRELGGHIDKCEACLNFLRTYDRTRILGRSMKPEEIPVEVRDRLKSFVIQKAGEHRPEVDKYLRTAAVEDRVIAGDVACAFRMGELSRPMADLVERHVAECPCCAKAIFAKADVPVPDIVVEHIAALLDKLPPGEVPFNE